MTDAERIRRAVEENVYVAGVDVLLAAEVKRLREEVVCYEAMKEGFSERLDGIVQEVASVLMLMDNLANVWGDEGVFRRCRDRLRQIVKGR